MNKPIHPAVAEHVMEENARLREVLRCIADLPMDRCSTENDYRLSAAKAIALGALSQQAEPCQDCDNFGDVHGPDGEYIGRCKCGKAEPAPAQDEREAFEAWAVRADLAYRSEQGFLVWHDDGEILAWSAWKSALATHPAQTEQQPIYQIRPRENVRDWLDTNADGYRAAKAMTSMEARVLYAAPIAQTAPVDALEHVSEGAELLQSMIDNIESKGNYSRESTVLFLNQALGCIRAAMSAQGESHE